MVCGAFVSVAIILLRRWVGEGREGEDFLLCFVIPFLA